MATNPRAIELFSGVGGFRLGLARYSRKNRYGTETGDRQFR